MTSREELLLPPTDPSISDENDWWEFELTETKILRPGKKLYANLLDATEENPVQVIGDLVLKPYQEHLLLEPESSSRRIIIDDVSHFAYGQMEDRSVALWVAGKAGWYRISPAKGYLHVHNHMVQAVDMYYFLMDRHFHGRKILNPTFKNLCQEYVFHTHGDCETREQSAEAFDLHGAFLLRCMIEDEEDMLWNNTNIFTHLRRKFQDEYKEIMARLSSPSENENDDEENEDGADHEDDEEPNLKTPRPDSAAAISESQANAIHELVVQLRDEGHLANRRLRVGLVVERFAECYSFSKADSQRIIDARASAVVDKLDGDKPGFRWNRYVIYRDFVEAATYADPDPLPPTLLKPLKNTPHQNSDGSGENTPLQENDDSSDDEALTRTQMSVLRPKNGAVSAKVMGKRNRSGLAGQPMTQSDNEEQDDDPDAMSDVETPSKSRGHELIRTPLASAKPPLRYLRSKSDSAYSMVQAMVNEVQPTLPPLASTLPIAERKESNEPNEPEKPFIPPLPDVDEPEPEPEVWNCRMHECDHTITTKGEQRLTEIKLHAGQHDWDTQMRFELAEKERRSSGLPVSHLMRLMLHKHIQQMRQGFPEVYSKIDETTSANGTTHSGATNGAGDPNSSQQERVSSHTPSRQLFTDDTVMKS